MKHIKLFESINHPARINQELGKGQNLYMVSVDMAAETLKVWGDTLSELGEIAPNCIFQNFNAVTPDYWEVIIVGSEVECTAIANYWNNLTGGNEVMVEPFRQPKTRY
jgi:hypothetical protein